MGAQCVLRGRGGGLMEKLAAARVPLGSVLFFVCASEPLAAFESNTAGALHLLYREGFRQDTHTRFGTELRCGASYIMAESPAMDVVYLSRVGGWLSVFIQD